MNLPVSRQSTGLAAAMPDFTYSEAKALIQRQNAERIRGLVAAARIQAGASVAEMGMNWTALLSQRARVQEQGDPTAALRFERIADQYAILVCGEVARFGQ